MNTIVFKKPFQFEGKEYTELTLDLDALTGQQLIESETETRALGDRTPMLEVSKSYQAVIAAKAAKVPCDLIKTLPAKEFSKVTVMVQNFLLE